MSATEQQPSVAEGGSALAKSSDPFWNPRPHPDSATRSRSAYHAGYSDAYHGYPFGSGDHGDFSDYRVGYDHGSSDKRDSEQCPECGGFGEYFGHADDCDSDSCALNGDIDSCNGQVIACHCAALTPRPIGEGK